MPETIAVTDEKLELDFGKPDKLVRYYCQEDYDEISPESLCYNQSKCWYFAFSFLYDDNDNYDDGDEEDDDDDGDGDGDDDKDLTSLSRAHS